MGAVPTVVALFGPTGVGKTAVALALAELLRGRGEESVAVAADALQVYRGLEVLTGAATPDERERLEHRLVGIVDATDTFSAGEYAPLAHREIDAALAEGRRPLVVGGTGLYLRAALADLSLAPPPPPGARRRWEAELAARGLGELHAELTRRVPAAGATVAATDRTRVLRALELSELGALPERWQGGDGSPATASELWTEATRHPTLLFALTMERAALYERIDRRVEEMVAAGAMDEVRRAEAAGASSTARKALGFDELLRGDVEGMKQRTRRLAKRQLTWSRKLAGAVELDLSGGSVRSAAEAIAELVVSREARG